MFREDFQVRDNEIDMQGIVNNANYFIYMAHARHNFLHEIGVDFSEMAKEQQFLMVTKATIEYKRSLKPNDKFYVTCKVVQHGENGFACVQDVRLSLNDKIMTTGYFEAACIDGHTKKRYIPEKIKLAFEVVI